MTQVVAKEAGMCAGDDDKTCWAGRRIHSCSDLRFISSKTRPLAAGVTGWGRGGRVLWYSWSFGFAVTTVLVLETPQFLYESQTNQRNNLLVISIKNNYTTCTCVIYISIKNEAL